MHRNAEICGAGLGGTLAVVRPHPVSVLIGCIPGLVMLLVASTGRNGLSLGLLLHPEIEVRAACLIRFPVVYCSGNRSV